MRRNRLCVAVKAGRQGDLPKGSMSLATSSTGESSLPNLVADVFPGAQPLGLCKVIIRLSWKCLRRSRPCKRGLESSWKRHRSTCYHWYEHEPDWQDDTSPNGPTPCGIACRLYNIHGSRAHSGAEQQGSNAVRAGGRGGGARLDCPVCGRGCPVCPHLAGAHPEILIPFPSTS